MTTVKVRVPGTTANCGPGFDTLGIACSIYNELTLTLQAQGGLTIEISGEGRGQIPADESNIAYQAAEAVLRRVGAHYDGIAIAMHNNIPLARGLGSSAAAIVAGLAAANAATGGTLSREELLAMATAMEGHPDNVAPALLGGITVSMMCDDVPKSLRFETATPLKLVVAVPQFGLATKVAREALPETVPFGDAVFNVSRTALLTAALCRGEPEFLKYAFADRLHQPYRQKLVPGLAEVLAAAVEAGAVGSALSGAGPCVVAFALTGETAIGRAMTAAFNQSGVQAEYLVLDIDSHGAKVAIMA